MRIAAPEGSAVLFLGSSFESSLGSSVIRVPLTARRTGYRCGARQGCWEMTPCPLYRGFSSQKKGLHPLKFRLICARCRAVGERPAETLALGKVKAMKSEAEAIRARLIALEDYRKLLNADVL